MTTSASTSKEGELDLLQDEVEKKFQDVLNTLVIDTGNDHNTQETARRVAKMWVKEVFGGRYKPKVTSFPNMGYKSMYTSGPITYWLCVPKPEHSW